MKKEPKLLFCTSNGIESISQELYQTIVNNTTIEIYRELAIKHIPTLDRSDERKLYEAYEVISKIVTERLGGKNK